MATARATASARPASLAPVTVSFIVRVEPSPSATIERASERSAASSARPSRASPSSPGFTPEAPLQRPSTVSLVDSWPSTVIMLNDSVDGPVQQLRPGGLADLGVAGDEAEHRRHVGADHAAALGGEAEPDLALRQCSPRGRRTWRACRWCGWPWRTGRTPSRRRRPAGRQQRRRCPARSFSIGRCTPISPVEHTATCSTGSRRWFAVSNRIRAASASPCLPVQALALPALTTTARRCAQSLVSRVRRTGRGGGGVAGERRRRDRRLLGSGAGRGRACPCS